MEVPSPTLAHCSVLEGPMHLFFGAGSLSDWTFGYFLGLVTSVHSAMRNVLCWVPRHDKNSYRASTLPLRAEVY